MAALDADTLRSVALLALKILVVLFLSNGEIAAFIYQNF